MQVDTDNRDWNTTNIVVDPADLFVNMLQNHSAAGNAMAKLLVETIKEYLDEALEHEDDAIQAETNAVDRVDDFATYIKEKYK